MNTQIVYEIVNNGFGFIKGSTFRIVATLNDYALVHMMDGEPDDWAIIESMDISDKLHKAIIHRARFFSSLDISPIARWIEWINANIVY